MRRDGVALLIVAVIAWQFADRLDRRQRLERIRPALGSVESSLKEATNALSSARNELSAWAKNLESKADELDRRYADLQDQQEGLALDPEAAKRVDSLLRKGDGRAWRIGLAQIGIGWLLGLVTPFAISWWSRLFVR